MLTAVNEQYFFNNFDAFIIEIRYLSSVFLAHAMPLALSYNKDRSLNVFLIASRAYHYVIYRDGFAAPFLPRKTDRCQTYTAG